MPGEGQTSVSIHTYIWKNADRYFKQYKKELRKNGIKSVTKLIEVWIEKGYAMPLDDKRSS